MIIAATILAEIGDCRDRYPSKQTLWADGAQAPVAVEARKSKRARFRWARDHRLRDAITHHNPWANLNKRARARGKTHPHAVRILGRAGGGVIWRLWQDHDVYDPARHAGLQQLLAAQAATN